MELFDYLLAKKGGGGGSSSDVDWSAIGYSDTPQAIVDGYNYAKQIKDNWEPSQILTDKFSHDRHLMIMPLVDTSNATNMLSMFLDCLKLTTIPLLNTSSVTNMGTMFRDCTKLSDTSLDNILQMCINATNYEGTKTLSAIGISNSTLVAKIPNLEHYQDFLNAGWSL